MSDCALILRCFPTLVVLNLAGFRAADEERSADVEQSSRLLGGQFGVGGHNQTPALRPCEARIWARLQLPLEERRGFPLGSSATTSLMAPSAYYEVVR